MDIVTKKKCISVQKARGESDEENIRHTMEAISIWETTDSAIINYSPFPAVYSEGEQCKCVKRNFSPYTSVIPFSISYKLLKIISLSHTGIAKAVYI